MARKKGGVYKIVEVVGVVIPDGELCVRHLHLP